MYRHVHVKVIPAVLVMLRISQYIYQYSAFSFALWTLLRLALTGWHSPTITDRAIDIVSSLLKIKYIESQKIKSTLLCGFERSIIQ